MLIPIVAALIPSLVNLAEKIIPQSDSGSQKKDFVQSILGKLYDKFLSNKIPDLQGIDERALFVEICSHVIDFAVDKMNNKASE